MSSPLSVFIPHVFINIDKDRIKRVFNTLYLGNVSNIDFVLKIDAKGNAYNAAYVHFESWYNTQAATSFQSRVLSSSEGTKLVYDEPWFWVVLENKAKKHLPGAPRRAINLTDYAESAYKAVPKNLCYDFDAAYDYEEDEASIDSHAKRVAAMNAWSEEEDDNEEDEASLDSHAKKVAAMNAWSEEEEEEDEDADEDAEMEQILDEMDETEQLMQEGTFDYVDATYCSALELDRQKLTRQLGYLTSTNKMMRRELEDVEELKKPFFDELQNLRAHIVYLKEVLAQYEPDERKQNKELYH